jgi:hypothetical protein
MDEEKKDLNENPEVEVAEGEVVERVVPEQQFEETVQVGGTVTNPPLGSLTDDEKKAQEEGMPISPVRDDEDDEEESEEE